MTPHPSARQEAKRLLDVFYEDLSPNRDINMESGIVDALLAAEQRVTEWLRPWLEHKTDCGRCNGDCQEGGEVKCTCGLDTALRGEGT